MSLIYNSPFPKCKILDPSELKGYRRQHFNLMKMVEHSPKGVESFAKGVENAVGKGEIAH